jgi:hypothetical protein
MNRREMLKVSTVGIASALVPTWFLHSRPKPINLAAFCGVKNYGQYSLDAPFAQDVGDRLYSFGTDGKICVRIAGDRALLDNLEGKHPPASRLHWDHDQLRGWRPWPKYDPVIADKARCLLCRNVVHPECEWCEGTGSNMDDDFMSHGACRKCKGSGIAFIHCPGCDGRGEGRGPDKQPIGHAMIDPYYDQLIRKECGEAEHLIQQRQINYPSGKFYKMNDVVFFRCAAGVGLLMPLDGKSS